MSSCFWSPREKFCDNYSASSSSCFLPGPTRGAPPPPYWLSRPSFWNSEYTFQDFAGPLPASQEGPWSRNLVRIRWGLKLVVLHVFLRESPIPSLEEFFSNMTRRMQGRAIMVALILLPPLAAIASRNSLRDFLRNPLRNSNSLRNSLP